MKIFWSILNTLIWLSGISGELCPNSCVCTSSTTNCAGLNFIFIPTQIPKGTEKLILRRNFIDFVNFDKQQTQKYFSKVQFLDLSYNRIRSLTYTSFKNFKSIQTLYLNFNEICSDGCNYSFNEISTTLTNLSLKHNKLSWEDLKYLCFELNHLLYLDLSFNQISLLKSSFFPKNLKYLDLSYNAITTIEPRPFSGLQHLEYLDIRGLNLKRIPKQTFVNLYKLKKLKIGGKNMIGINTNVFKDRNNIMIRLASLQYLEIGGGKIRNLNRNLLRCCPNINNLDISDNNISNLGNGFFSKTNFLKHLNITNNSFSNMKKLLKQLGVLNLTTLDLSLNLIPEPAIAAIVSTQPFLERINASYNNVMMLDTSFSSNSLKVIDFSFNSISFVAIDTFVRCTVLEKVFLTGNLLLTLPEINFFQSTFVFIGKNTWNCSCNFYKSLSQNQPKSSNLTFVCQDTNDLSCLQCSFPAELNNTLVENLSKTCNQYNIRSSNVDVIKVQIIFIILVTLFLCFLLLLTWRKRDTLKNYFNKINAKNNTPSQTVCSNDIYKVSSLDQDNIDQLVKSYPLKTPEPDLHSESTNLKENTYHLYQAIKSPSSDSQSNCYNAADSETNPYMSAASVPSKDCSEAVYVYNKLYTDTTP